jgi:hypothetical protein
MKCKNCKYSCKPIKDSELTTCLFFGREIPKKYKKRFGLGCNISSKKLAAAKRQNDEAILKEHRAFVKWILED